VIDEIERAVVGPVQVVDQHQDRLAVPSCQASQSLCRCAEGAVVDLLRIVADAPDMRAVVVPEADQVTEQVDLRFGVAVRIGTGIGLRLSREQRQQRILQFAPRDVEAVVVEDLRVPGNRSRTRAYGWARV
jgi:hypothetical protein